MTRNRPTQTTTARTVVLLLCMVLFVFLQALATVPSLHQHLHHDANQADHQCAVTLISQGSLHFTSGPAPIVLPTLFLVTFILGYAFVPVAVEYRLLPGRAPPSPRA